MKILFKQRFFSWLDSYDIFDEEGRVLYQVQGKLGWGHRLHILDAQGRHVATLREVLWTFLHPRFELLEGEKLIGTITKQLTLLKPRFTLDFNGWNVYGNWWEWDCRIMDANNCEIAVISKEVWRWTDTYVIDVAHPSDALYALMVVLAIDVEKCSRQC